MRQSPLPPNAHPARRGSTSMLSCRICAATFVSGFLILTLAAQDKPAAPTPSVTFKGHTEAIYSVAFNKEGNLAVTGSFDKSLRLWDPVTGKQLREFSGTAGHQGLVLTVAFNPAGDQVASGGADNFARVWDIPVNSSVRELAHAAGVAAVAVSPDGKTIAGAARDGSVRLWAADGQQLAGIAAHPGGTTGAAFSANSQLLATSGADGAIRFWNPADGKPSGVIGAHGSPATGVAFGNNIAYSIGEDGLLKFWQLPVAMPKNLPAHAEAVGSLDITPDGNTILTGGADKAVKLSNVVNGQLTREFAGATAAITAVALWPNGAAVAAGG